MGVLGMDEYASATAHYSSLRRYDAVKRRWDQPHFVEILACAVRFLRNNGLRHQLRVLDVGAGAGEGFGLLAQVQALGDLCYTALDRSESMLKLAENRLGR